MVSKNFIIFYLIPLKLSLKVIFNTVRILDILLSLFYFGNFNLREIGFYFFLNFISIVIFLGLTLATIKKKNQFKHFKKLYLGYRILFFLFNFVIHLMGALQLSINRNNSLNEFEFQTKLKVKQDEFYDYITELIIFQSCFTYVDFIHIGWTFSIKDI